MTTSVSCPICRATKGRHKMDCQNRWYMDQHLQPLEDKLRHTGGLKMKVWVTEGNRDNTEGRGPLYNMFFSEKEATARRLGKGKYVQGHDCPVREMELLEVDGKFYVPSTAITIKSPSAEDFATQGKLDAKNEALVRARDLGLTVSELQALGVNV